MEAKQTLKKSVNRHLTQRIIALHQQGWDADFLVWNNNALVNLQKNESYPLHSVDIQLIDLDFDVLSGSFGYIYTIETDWGERGLLIVNAIVTNKFIA
jgi:hypothetical protein